MGDKEKKEDGDWIRVASTSHLGRYYLFNKATGERKSGTESNPKCIQKVSRTPAQDRLKRLQHQLKTTQKAKHNYKGSCQPSFAKLESKKEQIIHLNDSPSTSSTDKVHTRNASKQTDSKIPFSSLLSEDEKMTLAQDRLKRLQHKLKTTQKAKHNYKGSCQPSFAKFESGKAPINHINDSPSTSSSDKIPTKTTSKQMAKTPHSSLLTEDETQTIAIDKIRRQKLFENSSNLKLPADNDVSTESFQKLETGNTWPLSNLRSGIINKIKSICKIPFIRKNRSSQETAKSKDEPTSSISLANTNCFKPSKRIRENQKRYDKLPDNIAREFISNTYTSMDLTTSAAFKSKSASIPTCTRGSANSRLERLKESFHSQQQQQQLYTLETKANTITTTELSSQIPISNSGSIKNDHNLIALRNNENDCNSSNSLQHTASKANSDDEETEAMDWQPIVKDEETLNEMPTNSIDIGFTIEKSKKCLFLTTDANDNQTMGDIYDTVNENLLRMSAEKEQDSIRYCDKWSNDFYYFIIDTNVLIHDLTFVEDLTKMKLCDTKGSMLYIPYTVLQELDKLKMRSGMQEGVKTLAIRAIKYLNEKFESKSVHIKAQSALDEKEHLIDVSSADDSILNCCLQVKKYIKNLLLLSEDVNLRNKAICNNILVSTKSDLISKHYNINDNNKTL